MLRRKDLTSRLRSRTVRLEGNRQETTWRQAETKGRPGHRLTPIARSVGMPISVLSRGGRRCVLLGVCIWFGTSFPLVQRAHANESLRPALATIAAAVK